jgi:hypothetical protein
MACYRQILSLINTVPAALLNFYVWLVIGQVKGEAVPVHAMKAYLGMELQINLFVTSPAQDTTSSQPHALAALPPAKESLVTTDYKTVCTPEPVPIFWRKHLVPAGIQTLGHPGHTPVTILTTLSMVCRVWIVIYTTKSLVFQVLNKLLIKKGLGFGVSFKLQNKLQNFRSCKPHRGDMLDAYWVHIYYQRRPPWMVWLASVALYHHKFIKYINKFSLLSLVLHKSLFSALGACMVALGV